MTANVGRIDQALRILIGLTLLSLVFIGPKTLWGLAGLILVATAGLRFCPAYRLLGIRTCAA